MPFAAETTPQEGALPPAGPDLTWTHEAKRITVLRRYQILDTAPDPAFDRITALAADLFGKKVALISFVDDRRAWVKSVFGSEVSEYLRVATICRSTVAQAKPRVIADLLLDASIGPILLPGSDQALRFYAAYPLVTPDGFSLGTLAVLDDQPDPAFGTKEQSRLQMLAGAVMDLLERKRAHDEHNRDRAEIALIRDIQSLLTEKLSFSALLDRTLLRLLNAFDAYACRVWERRGDDPVVGLVSRVCIDPIDTGHHEDLGGRNVRLSDLLTNQLFDAENATMWRVTTPDDRDHPRFGPAVAAGIGCLVGCSLSLGDRRFALVTTFKGIKADLEERAALLGRIGLAIRPILQQKLNDERTALLGTALETTHDGVIIAEITSDDDHYHRIVYVNAALTAQTGYRSDELVGHSLAILNVPEADLAEIERIKAAMRRGEPVRTMLQRRRRDGSVFWAETTLVPLLDTQGVATHRVGIMRDMSHQHAEEEDLRQRERVLLATTKKLETLTAQLIRTQQIAKLGTWRRMVESEDLEWSDSVYPMFGVTKGSFVPTLSSVLAHIHPDDQELLHSRLVFAGEEAIAYSVTYRTIGDDGAVRTLSSDCACECAPDGSVIAISGILQDITDQKHAQAMLLQAEKLRSIGQLTGGIAHDFNNLLTVVSVNLEMLGDMIGADHQAEELRAMALRAAEGGAQLTSNLLSFARRQSLQPESCNVNALLAGLRDMAQHSIGERHPITLSLDPDLPSCLLDRSGFESAILNLLVNSRDAMVDGGTISIATAVHRIPAGDNGRTQAGLGQLRLGQVGADTYICVSVSDSGQGIAPHLLERVFEPFFTTKPVGRGTGLGLSTVIGFVRQSGGDVELASQVNLGTEVKLYLPITLTTGVSTPADRTLGRLASFPAD